MNRPGSEPSWDTENEVLSPATSHKVGVGSVILLGLSGQQIIPAALIGAAYMPLESGNGAWLSMLLAMCATWCVMSAVNIFARRYVVTGSLMSYVGLVFGKRLERLVAGSYLLGFLIACAAVTASTVMFTSSFLHSVGLEFANAGWFQSLSAIAIAILAGTCAWRGLDASISLTAWLAFLSLPLVLVATVSAASQSGLDIQSQAVLAETDWHSIVRGAIVGLAYFVGIDALASLAAETKNPKKNVPVILTSVLLITGITYVVVLLVCTPLMNAHVAELNEGLSPTAIITRAAGMEYLQNPIDLLLIGATFASLVAFINYGSRVFATAALNRFIPEIFSRIHPKFGSPTGATILMSVPSAVIPVALQTLAASPPLQSTAYLSTLYSLFWVGPYIILCIGAIKEIFRETNRNLLQIVVVFTGMGAFLALLVDSFFSGAEGVMYWLPYITVGLTIAGYFALTVNQALSKPTTPSEAIL
ncbi:APC family permease [Sinorhizobium meliloti]|uniref:APC family permease n=1 Tax=Rhizobium meliloti TaxID=382 RepID=UPI000FD44DF4|nr:APC family permease [Sinorhizobium meliloti]MQV32736.1 amino acid permease [Sinorhizobium meliloti]RVM02794.1 APC family permease [Sinorhizobium meliloti]RVM39942.1 APC family permease [Sinorhizobium meliloti]RVM55899.1 APC family permease [Sinorhizobium meliloti]RVM60067.1 APC family permease [Sinorhizobium meliloti]